MTWLLLFLTSYKYLIQNLVFVETELWGWVQQLHQSALFTLHSDSMRKCVPTWWVLQSQRNDRVNVDKLLLSSFLLSELLNFHCDAVKWPTEKGKEGCIAWIQNLKWNQNIVEAVSPTHTLDLCILMPAQVYSVTHFSLESFFKNFICQRKMPFAID